MSRLGRDYLKVGQIVEMFRQKDVRLIAVNDGCASSLPGGTVTRTIGKTTYIANLHFKSQGQTFSQKLKRVLRADCAC